MALKLWENNKDPRVLLAIFDLPRRKIRSLDFDETTLALFYRYRNPKYPHDEQTTDKIKNFLTCLSPDQIKKLSKTNKSYNLIGSMYYKLIKDDDEVITATIVAKTGGIERRAYSPRLYARFESNSAGSYCLVPSNDGSGSVGRYSNPSLTVTVSTYSTLPASAEEFEPPRSTC